jgi:hypothetical protein
MPAFFIYRGSSQAIALSRPRSGNNQFILYAADTSKGWRVNKRISFVDGERGVDRGAFVRVYDDFDKHVGYQLTAGRIVDYDVKPQGAHGALSLSEMHANAGVDGRSRTIHLSEDDRLERVRFGLHPEDSVERAIKKVKVYERPAPGRGDRAIRVYPKETQSSR